ncbi:MAG TPA: thiolase family protein [Solirubrobacterales bacterium]|jgi:acetyl-CoA acetyltransferase family protein
MKGEDVYIVEAVRTPVGRGHREKGIFRDVHPAELLGRTFVELLDRAGVDSGRVDNAIAGCVYQIGEQATGITRNAWLGRGLAAETGAITVDIRCGSGQEATHFGALRIAAGIDDLVVTGGVESMSRIGFPVNEAAQEQFGRGHDKELLDRYELLPQGLAAELIAERWGVTREASDEFSALSQQRAAAASEAGAFRREIMDFEAGGEVHSADQGIRPGTTAETLAALKPAFKEGGTLTGGNSSQISDGAAALLLANEATADELGLTKRARIVDEVTLGVDPITMLTGPIPATREILARNNLRIGDLDAIEINEAFASVVLAWEREHSPDMAKVNPRGGAIALGHPLGSTGARLLTTLVHELEDDDGELGLVTMCCAGGLGTATLIQRV